MRESSSLPWVGPELASPGKKQFQKAHVPGAEERLTLHGKHFPAHAHRRGEGHTKRGLKKDVVVVEVADKTIG